MISGEQPVLGQRALNRALLERQWLLRRVDRSAPEALSHLVGLQAQATPSPYYGLLARLRGFDPRELGRMLKQREAVRMTLMRGTVHLALPADAAWLRPLVQVVIERGHNGAFGRRMGGADTAELGRAAAALLGEEPLGARELGRRLVERGIGGDAEAIGNAVRVYAALVQVPPRGIWGKSGRALYMPFERWTGVELDPSPAVDELIRRYLAAFGPASVKDIQNWSGLTKLKAEVERLRPRLLSFRSEDGVELFDLPEAPRPPAETPAPVRFLGEYDNVLLGHADRSRVIPADFPWKAMLGPGRFVNNLLVDGTLRATWWVERDGKRSATLAIRPWKGLTKAEREEITAEAEPLIEFAGQEAAARAVRFEPPVP